MTAKFCQVLQPSSAVFYQCRDNISIKRLGISAPAIPYYPTPVFMPTNIPIKGSDSHSLSLKGPIYTNPNPKDIV